ncbi:Putative Holin-X, holin superfamily III [Sinosporangium album]|uniref:Putative Holin-X, holin superfamily III n=1 Tax=Sinosporangium album TaxID=504805 RepID=A0A1G7U421_9ACTN|nr:phage holin family protein [Sinosporangium album]SDG42154.1 Putative Holin-X, holin superfamily III [Sinosporangium album]
MPQTPAPPPEGESLGALVAEATTHISTLIRSEIELAKAEVRFDAKRVGTAGGLFAAAAFMAHLCLILGSFTIAYALVALGLWQWLAFLIVTVFYLVVSTLLVFIGYRRLKGLSGMKRTTRTLRDLKDIANVDGKAPAVQPHGAPGPESLPTAGQVGIHRVPLDSASSASGPKSVGDGT